MFLQNKPHFAFPVSGDSFPGFARTFGKGYFGRVEQLEARPAHSQKVAGSNPAPAYIFNYTFAIPNHRCSASGYESIIALGGRDRAGKEICPTKAGSSKPGVSRQLGEPGANFPSPTRKPSPQVCNTNCPLSPQSPHGHGRIEPETDLSPHNSDPTSISSAMPSLVLIASVFNYSTLCRHGYDRAKGNCPKCGTKKRH